MLLIFHIPSEGFKPSEGSKSELLRQPNFAMYLFFILIFNANRLHTLFFSHSIFDYSLFLFNL